MHFQFVFLMNLIYRKLTHKQRTLLLSYAEDEMDVEGTVTGVTRPATGRSTNTFIHTDNINAK